MSDNYWFEVSQRLERLKTSVEAVVQPWREAEVRWAQLWKARSDYYGVIPEWAWDEATNLLGSVEAGIAYTGKRMLDTDLTRIAWDFSAKQGLSESPSQWARSLDQIDRDLTRVGYLFGLSLGAEQ